MALAIHYGLSPREIRNFEMWEVNHMIELMNDRHKSGKGCYRCGIPSKQDQRMMR